MGATLSFHFTSSHTNQLRPLLHKKVQLDHTKSAQHSLSPHGGLKEWLRAADPPLSKPPPPRRPLPSKPHHTTDPQHPQTPPQQTPPLSKPHHSADPTTQQTPARQIGTVSMAPPALQLSCLYSDFAILKQLEEKAEFLMTPYLDRKSVV